MSGEDVHKGTSTVVSNGDQLNNASDDVTNLNDRDASSESRSLGATGGARPKIKTKAPSPQDGLAATNTSLVSLSPAFFHQPEPSSWNRNDDNLTDKDEEEADVGEDEELTADLPKSFYNYCADCSDSELNLGVSGAGQSNLSNEVAAALMQNELSAYNRLPEYQGRYRRQPQRNAASNDNNESPDDAQERPESPEFLEMDFDPDDSTNNSDSGDSGRGADETTDGNDGLDDDKDEEVDRPPSRPPQEIPEQRHQADVLEPIALPVENNHFDPLCCQQLIPKCGMTSAPLQSPATPEEAVMMVRSQSLNSPLMLVSDERRPDNNLLAATSDVGGDNLLTLGNFVTSSGRPNKRHRSGSGIETSVSPLPTSSNGAYASDPSVNREVCGIRLSNRETMVFGLPSPDTSVEKALVKLWSGGDVAAFGNRWPTSKEEVDSELSIEKSMVWTELEACRRQVNQVGASACGATAVINILQALEVPHSVDEVIATVPTKLRANDSPVATYLFSRSIAGTNHADLINAVKKISNGQIFGRFFHMYPRRCFQTLDWLAKWIRKGAVPIATLNLQRGEVRPGQTIPDAWHHQMVFGVGPNGVYLTNPLESVPLNVLREQLCSPSELLVRRSDVACRWNDESSDLHQFYDHEDERWDNYNVLGQVVNVIREEKTCRWKQAAVAAAATGTSQTILLSQQHIRIPAVYKSGISLFVLKSKEAAYSELKSCPELPILVQMQNKSKHGTIPSM